LEGIEGPSDTVAGLGYLPATTQITGDKRVQRVSGVELATNAPFEGYEIHSGRTLASGLAPLLRFADGTSDGAISDLLDLTAISKGKLSLQFQPVDVHELLLYAINIAQSQGGERALQIVELLKAESHYVLSDPTRLQQVFWNLISNAVKFSPEGGSILVTTRNENDRLVVEVSDSGMGMEPDTINRIFDPFEQGNSEITNHFGGLGLGLSIAKGFVELLGGSIRAQSEGTGQGATFSVTLKSLADPLGDSL